MSDHKPTWREREDQRRAAQADAGWGMQYMEDPDPRSPERIAYDAYQAGDQLLQLEIPAAWVQGGIGVGTSATRLRRPERSDVLGAVEQQGWKLEMMSAAFVQTGSSATKRVLANAGSTEVATHGTLFGVYVFRRRERESAPPDPS